MAGGLHGLLLLETCHAVGELIKLCALWMDAIQPGGLLCDGSVTGGILIVRAIDLNQVPLSVMRRARAKTESFPFAVFLFLNMWTCVCHTVVCLYSLHTVDRPRKGENTSNTHCHRYSHPWKRVFGMWVLCRVELRRADVSSESLGEETGDLTMQHRAFYRHWGSRDGSKWITLSHSCPFATLCVFQSVSPTSEHTDYKKDMMRLTTQWKLRGLTLH